MIRSVRQWLGERLLGGASAFVRLRLEHVRVLRILEHVRAVWELTRDGHEKLEEEYVFDQAFVRALVEEALERCAAMVFDATLLVPATSEELTGQQAALTRYAQRRFLLPDALASFGDHQTAAAAETFPEERMLTAALAWLEGPGRGDEPGVGRLIRAVLDSVFCGLADGPRATVGPAQRLSLAVGDAGTRMELVDLGHGDGRGPPVRGLRDVTCFPLAALLQGVDTTTAAAAPAGGERWIAVADEGQVQLRRHGPAGTEVWILASFSGHADGDFLFLYVRDPAALPDGVFAGLQTARTKLGRCAWVYNTPADELEAHLEALGSSLLDGPGDTRK